MSVGPEVFGEDYLYFYETVLTDDRADDETEVIWRVLDLCDGAEVLDVACGHGRIASRLAARGAHVTGIDADAYFLERARAAGAAVEYVEGDMRSLPWREPRFDAALLWFTAFGYFDDATNLEVLRGIRHVLRDGGRLALELNHLPFVLAHFQLENWLLRGTDAVLDAFEWVPQESVMRTRRTYLRGGAVREIAYDVRMYMPAELRAILLAAGFTRVELLGRDGEPLTADDRRLVAVAHA